MATQWGKIPNTPRMGQATDHIERRNKWALALLVLRIKIPVRGPTANASGGADRQPCNRGSPSRVAASVLEPRPPYWVRLACIWPAHSRRQSGLRAGLVYLSADWPLLQVGRRSLGSTFWISIPLITHENIKTAGGANAPHHPRSHGR